MSKKPSNLVNPNLPTVTLPAFPPLLRFLAKTEKGTPPFGSLNTPPTVSILRYGNRTQAEAKRQALAPFITLDGSASAVVQVESRFLIAIFPAEYDLDQKSGELIPRFCNARLRPGSDDHCQRPAVSGSTKCRYHDGGSAAIVQRRRPLFATFSGRRFNPRNRHNQNLPDDGQLVYCQQTIPPSESKTVRDLLAKGTATDRRADRAVSDRLN